METLRRAETALERAAAIDPESAMTDLAVAFYYSHALEDMDRALPDYHASIEKQPSYYPVYRWMGDALKMNNRYDEALQAYHKVQELNPRNKYGFLEAANIHDLLGRREERSAMLKRLVALLPDEINSFRGHHHISRFHLSASETTPGPANSPGKR